MKYEATAAKYGFSVQRERYDAELNGTLVEMLHVRSGAKLAWLDNGAGNKLFAVTFKTLPEDHTGIFHILEHSTLCGSKKYPMREPFLELLKGSMNTFLNAMTWPDKTSYPVASRNDEDFLNLMGVYLDAVFAPRFLEDANILYQEGWHIEQDEDRNLSYKGVVFNEMKGAMSDEDELMSMTLAGMIFPDNCYGYNSGGDPEHIPELTYTQFVDTYRRFYHPSNSYVYLDGAVPLDDTLRMIDEYLSRYDATDDVPVLVPQKPVSSERTICYEIGKDEDEKDKGRFSFGKIISNWDDPVKNAAADILSDVLAGSNEAPLKKAVLDSGLAKSFSFMLDDSVAQPYFVLTLKDVKDGCDNELMELIRRTAADIAAKGIDRDELNASINRYEFRIRDMREPAGLMRCFSGISYWMNGGDLLEGMVHDKLFRELRAAVETGYYEKLAGEIFNDDTGLAVLHTRPSKTLGEEMRRAEEERLQAIKDTWTEEDFAANAEMNKKLVAWQVTPDTPEQLATLPMLELSAVSEEPEIVPTEAKEIGGVTVLMHKIPCNGIVHFNAYFSLADLSLEELTDAALMPKLLGKLDTGKHTARELQQLVKRYVGRMDFSVNAFAKDGRSDAATPCLTASCSVLENDLDTALELVAEILTSTKFDQKDQIRHIVTQADIMSRGMAVNAGNMLGMLNALAHYSSAATVNEATAGRTFINRLHAVNAEFDNLFDGICALMQRVQQKNICRAGLVLSVTATDEKDTAKLTDALPVGEKGPAYAAYSCESPMRVGVKIPAQASFAVQGYSLKECGVDYDAGFKVAAHIMTYDYLWGAVRVQGGAYGTGLRAENDGSICAYSYRDPTPGATLGIYAEMADRLNAFCDAGESVDKYVLSTIAKYEPLIAPRQQGAAADADWFTGVTAEDRTRMKKEILATDHAKLRKFADVLKKFASDGAVCVVGHEAALEKCGELTMAEI